jgi:hypothetical protein
LKALRVGRVKIDGSFVRDILTEPRSKAAVNGILELARSMSLETVAEYVETDAIATAMRDMGVDYAQGYAYGKPQPLEQVLTDVAQESPLDPVPTQGIGSRKPTSNNMVPSLAPITNPSRSSPSLTSWGAAVTLWEGTCSGGSIPANWSELLTPKIFFLRYWGVSRKLSTSSHRRNSSR